jgi:hypothetical protein
MLSKLMPITNASFKKHLKGRGKQLSLMSRGERKSEFFHDWPENLCIRILA